MPEPILTTDDLHEERARLKKALEKRPYDKHLLRRLSLVEKKLDELNGQLPLL